MVGRSDYSPCSRNAHGLVCLVGWSFWSVWLFWMYLLFDQRDKPDRRNRPDEPELVGRARSGKSRRAYKPVPLTLRQGSSTATQRRIMTVIDVWRRRTLRSVSGGISSRGFLKTHTTPPQTPDRKTKTHDFFVFAPPFRKSSCRRLSRSAIFPPSGMALRWAGLTQSLLRHL